MSVASANPIPRSKRLRVWRWWPVVIIALVVLVALLAPWLAPYDPNQQNLLGRLKPPSTVSRSFHYWLGSDELGRDLLSRVIYGARISLIVAFASVILSGAVGTTLGMIAGYHRGWVEIAVMRVVDVFLSIPAILLAIITVAVLGPGIVNALYLIQDYTGWIAEGASNVDWWQLHNGMVTSGDNGSSLYGTANYGDYGILSDATCGTVNGSQVCEPAADTPFPSYYGLKLLGRFLRPGDTLVSTTSSQSGVQSYAASAPDGTLRVMLVNDDPGTTYSVSLGYSGFTPQPGAAPVVSLTAPGSSLTTGQGSATRETLPPYSATLLTLRPATS